MQLVVTQEAERDLARIADFVGVDGSAAATAFLDDLQASLMRLVETPEAYPILPRIARPRYADASSETV